MSDGIALSRLHCTCTRCQKIDPGFARASACMVTAAVTLPGCTSDTSCSDGADCVSFIVQVLGVQANKLQLSREGVGFLKDAFSLSFYNVSSDFTLSLSVRGRGGRKK